MEPLIFSHEIGIIAGVFLVVAYGLMNFGVLTTSSPWYQALNVLGALGFAYTALAPFNPGLLITEIVWAIVAVGFLWKIFIHKSKASDDAADTDAAETEAADTDAAETEAADTDAAETEAADTDAAETEAVLASAPAR